MKTAFNPTSPVVGVVNKVTPLNSGRRVNMWAKSLGGKGTSVSET